MKNLFTLLFATILFVASGVGIQAANVTLEKPEIENIDLVDGVDFNLQVNELHALDQEVDFNSGNRFEALFKEADLAFNDAYSVELQNLTDEVNLHLAILSNKLTLKIKSRALSMMENYTYWRYPRKFPDSIIYS